MNKLTFANSTNLLELDSVPKNLLKNANSVLPCVAFPVS